MKDKGNRSKSTVRSGAGKQRLNDFRGTDPRIESEFNESAAPSHPHPQGRSGQNSAVPERPATPRQIDFVRRLLKQVGRDDRPDPASLSSAEAHRLIDSLLDAGHRSPAAPRRRVPPNPGSIAKARPPFRKASDRQLSYLDTLARRAGKSIDESMANSLDTVGANRMIRDLKRQGFGPPTKRQLDYARRLARLNAETLPDDCLRCRAACSRFIEAYSCGQLSDWTD